MLTLISYVNLLKVGKRTYTLIRPRYAFVIPKCRLNISIHACSTCC